MQSSYILTKKATKTNCVFEMKKTNFSFAKSFYL